MVIDFVEGKLEEKGEEGAVISVGGLGLSLFLSTPTLQNLSVIGEKVRLYSYLHVREDLLQLYGFRDCRERELFLKLISVSGIGPKVAMALLSAYDPETFVRLVSTEDLEAITAVSGVGKKSGQSKGTGRVRHGGKETDKTGDLVNISSEAAKIRQLTSMIEDIPDIRESQVNALKQKVKTGQYQPDSNKTARAIIRESILDHLLQIMA